MSRLVKIAAVLALLVFIIVPGVTGFLVESSIEKAETGYGQAINSGPFELVNDTFERGWFSSDQNLELKLTEPEVAAVLHAIGGHKGGAEVPSLLVDTKATHGVIPLASPSRGGLRPAVAQTESTLSLKYKDGTVVPLPVKVFSSLGTGQWARIIADPVIDPDLGPDTKIQWDGADISANFSSSATTYEGKIGALNLDASGSRIESTPLAIEGNFKKTRFEFSTNQTSMALEKITIAPPAAMGHDPVTVNSIKGSAGLELDDSRAIATSKLSVGAVENAPMAIDGMELDAVYDVDAEALSAFIRESRKIQADYDSNNTDPTAILAAMNQILAEGAEFHLNKLNVEIGGGTLSMNLNVKLPEGSNSTQAAMANGEASGNVVIPDSVVEALGAVSPELAGGLTMAAMMGFVQQRDGAYEARVSYKNGVLLLNDLPVPLPF